MLYNTVRLPTKQNCTCVCSSGIFVVYAIKIVQILHCSVGKVWKTYECICMEIIILLEKMKQKHDDEYIE